MSSEKQIQAELADGLAEVTELRARAIVREGAVLRSALEAAGWLEARAAALLGIARSTLQGKLASPAHAALAREARARRTRMGYRDGYKGYPAAARAHAR